MHITSQQGQGRCRKRGVLTVKTRFRCGLYYREKNWLYSNIYGTAEKTRKPPIQTKSRRQQEIDWLVKERRMLQKQWWKAAEEEKDGINVLQTRDTSSRNIEKSRILEKEAQEKGPGKVQFLQGPFKVYEKSVLEGKK